MTEKIKELTLISAIYNKSAFLESFVETVLKQTIFESCDFIFIDDGSTDDSLLLLNNLCKNYSNFLVLSQKNQGPYNARYNAAKLAKTKYLIFADADDFLNIHYCEYYLQVAKKENADLVLNSIEGDSLSISSPYITEEIKKKILQKNAISNVQVVNLLQTKNIPTAIASMFLCKKTLFMKSYVETNFKLSIEDTLLGVYLLYYSEKIVFFRCENLYLWNKYNENSWSKTPVNFDHLLFTAKKCYELINNNRIEKAKFLFFNSILFCFLIKNISGLALNNLFLYNQQIKQIRIILKKYNGWKIDLKLALNTQVKNWWNWKYYIQAKILRLHLNWMYFLIKKIIK